MDFKGAKTSVFDIDLIPRSMNNYQDNFISRMVISAQVYKKIIFLPNLILNTDLLRKKKEKGSFSKRLADLLYT